MKCNTGNYINQDISFIVKPSHKILVNRVEFMRHRIEMVEEMMWFAYRFISLLKIIEYDKGKIILKSLNIEESNVNLLK